jgi:hypothetical protein
MFGNDNYPTIVALTGLSLLKCGQLQSFLNKPHPDKMAVNKIAANKNLTIFIIGSITNY